MTPTAKTRRLVVSQARWNVARRRKADALDDLNTAIRAASEDGMTQAEVARVLGWPRQRVNSVLGK
jgi:DNA-binding transcriptional regulator LsrR (DeoR family)